MENLAETSLQHLTDSRARDPVALERARELVLEYGWNATSYQILNPGIQRWFAPLNKGVVGFVSANGVRVVAGAPICGKGNMMQVAAAFENEAAQNKERVCYFCAERRLESIYTDSKNHSKFLLGAQPVWQPKNWAEIIKNYKSLRAQVNRARNKKVVVTEWKIERAHDNPLLVEVLQEWLASKGLPPLAFLVEPNTLARLVDRRVFVAEQDEKIVGFLLLSPIAQRNGWLFEQFIHRPGVAPNGTVELMIDTAMRKLAEENYDYVTLGLAPLSKRAKIEPFENPLWLRLLLAWMRKHGQRFYNFDGLDAFKAKLQPEEWEPVFAISNEKRISPRTLYAIASAFSGNAPISLFIGGLWKALKTEIVWLKEKIKRKLFKK